MNKFYFQIGLITLIFAAIFFSIRALPEACGVLHYEISETTADGVEMCSDDVSGLVDLDQLKYPGALEIEWLESDQEGIMEGVLRVMTVHGQALLPHEVAITHSERIHLLIVSDDLEDYHHIHPQPDMNSGEWLFEFHPKQTGHYQIYAECVPLRMRKQLLLTESVEVAEVVDSKSKGSVLAEELSTDWTIGYDGQLRANRASNFSISLERPDGQEMIFEEFMDAFSHAVAFRRGTTGYAHIHPGEQDRPVASTSQSFDFEFLTGKPGSYRIWAQFLIDGKTVFIAKDITVT